ncbi:L-alanine-DL-glutamate epimerase-like enolase superfamily enzyme [Stella humosa]|uniref:L-alanine-DL-glutamate epimerase-like enolase superfamily enzyme n=1 Tax=Stella humosa TaxID=94 RepID=A0A3N1MDR3_9PROT|nr:mandelate racemase/muconate lactonizing enzyme family protein [Stella humosa]ROQ01871.1 L-alanine-DL-glutamate epimerase-like enolase superfamily enzyme [Stella humosa]BBK32260.1 enolase [Stella humosa]
MKIAAVETIVVRLPFRHDGPPSGFGGKIWTTMDTLLVKVETDAGITGWGEAFGFNCIPATKAAIDSQIAPLAIGEDAGDIAGTGRRLQHQLHVFGRNGPVTFGLSGLDIALWDIAGKVAGLPLHRLLGGGGRADLPAYASLLRYTDPDVVGRVSAAAAARGHRHIKLHEVTIEATAAARAAVGPDVAIMLDTNCPWTLDEAMAMARGLAPLDLHWLEEPLWPPENHGGLAALRARAGIPIAAGENVASPMDFAALFRAGAVDIAQPSVTKIGGVTAMREVMAVAAAHNVQVTPHAPYFGPGLLATIQVIAASPLPILVERLHVDMEPDLFGGLTAAPGGRMRVPHGPGLGCDPDPAVIAQYGV